MKDNSRNMMPDRPWPGTTTTALTTDQGGSDKYATGSKPELNLPKNEITIGTWNVRTLYQFGKIDELENELQRYRWDILGISEARLTGIGESMTDEGHKLWFSGHETHHKHGVAFLVHKNKIDCVISCTPVNSRIIALRLSAKPRNITVIQIYAPTSDYEDQDVEEFYEQLENTIKLTPKKDIIFVQGDFNAKIGTDSFELWKGTVGRFTLGDTNDRGLRLLEFASNHKLTFANTLHPHKASRITTWHAPNGKTHNQIDFILTPKQFKSSINKAKTRTYPGADIGSDHDLVLLSFKVKLKCKQKYENPRIKFDLEKLKDPEINKKFQAQLGGRFAALNIIDMDINEITSHYNEAITDTAEEVLGRHRKKHKPWISNELLSLCDERRQLRKSKYQSPEGADLYRRANQKVRQKMKEAKEQWIDKQCANIDKDMDRGNSKRAFETLKLLTSSRHCKAAVIEDKEGKLLTESSAVLQRWSEYCAELYNYPLQPDRNTLENATTQEQPSPLPVLKEEVQEAIKTLAEGKSPGADNIPAELIKNGGPEIVNILTHICQKIWQTKEWPIEWTRSLVIPIPKKGNSRKCKDHRTISLISHASKVMLRVLLNRLKNEAEHHLAEEQAGFRAGRGTVEQIFISHIMMEKHLQHQRELYHNFIDFRKAFDRVWHEGLWHVMRKFGIEEGLIQTIESLYSASQSAVLMTDKIGESFKTPVGVRQGCLLSPTLFNLYLENIMQEALHGFESTISIGGRTISNLRFADDIDLLAGSKDELQNLTNRLAERSSAYGMEVSTEKSKVLVNSMNDNINIQIKMNGEELEQVNNFKYLGATLTRDGKSITEIKIRLAMATSAMTKLGTIWKNKCICFTTKMKLYKSLILSILLYGCECWTMTAETTKRIQSFEFKAYRKILGISWKEHKTNDYVINQITLLAGIQEPILSTIRRRKLKWFGHVARHDSMTKTVMQGTLSGGRKRGRQQKSWMDNIKEWTRLDSPTLTRKAEDRQEWRKLAWNSSLMSPLRPSGLRE